MREKIKKKKKDSTKNEKRKGGGTYTGVRVFDRGDPTVGVDERVGLFFDLCKVNPLGRVRDLERLEHDGDFPGTKREKEKIDTSAGLYAKSMELVVMEEGGQDGSGTYFGPETWPYSLIGLRLAFL